MLDEKNEERCTLYAVREKAYRNTTRLRPCAPMSSCQKTGMGADAGATAWSHYCSQLTQYDNPHRSGILHAAFVQRFHQRDINTVRHLRPGAGI